MNLSTFQPRLRRDGTMYLGVSRESFANRFIRAQMGPLYDLHGRLAHSQVRAREMLEYVPDFDRPCMRRARRDWISHLLLEPQLWTFHPCSALELINPYARSFLNWTQYGGHSTVGMYTVIRMWTGVTVVGTTQWQLYVSRTEPWGSMFRVANNPQDEEHLFICMFGQMCDLLDDPFLGRTASHMLAKLIYLAFIEVSEMAHGQFSRAQEVVDQFNNMIYIRQG